MEYVQVTLLQVRCRCSTLQRAATPCWLRCPVVLQYHDGYGAMVQYPVLCCSTLLRYPELTGCMWPSCRAPTAS
jgi:hypothetical protein